MEDKDNITIRLINTQDQESELIAFIWNASANSGMVMSYQHIGQHGEASLEFHDEDTRSLRYIDEIEKAQELISELRSIGYNI